jgi:hypothetical protein
MGPLVARGYTRYPWVLPTYRYETQDQLIRVLGERVIEPAERMHSSCEQEPNRFRSFGGNPLPVADITALPTDRSSLSLPQVILK